MRRYRDEAGHIVTEDELRAEFDAMEDERKEQEGLTFDQWMHNCLTYQGGTLEEIKEKREGGKMAADFDGFKITSTHAQAKPGPWGGAHNARAEQHHVVTVQRDGKRTRFDYWASRVHPTIDSESDLLRAFSCFVNDAISGEYDIDEFFREFGYEKASEGIRAWKGCQSAKRKLDRLYDGDIYELLNSLEDYR